MGDDAEAGGKARTDAGAAEWLPSLEMAAGVGLPDTPPQASRKLAALIVVAQILRRETWRETRVLSPGEADAMARSPRPGTGPGFGSWAVSFDAADAMGVRSRLEHVTDKVVDLQQVFIPSELSGERHLFGVAAAIEELVPKAPSDAFECKDLRSVQESSAYRGARGVREPPKFHGHDFGDSIVKGKAVVDALLTRGRVLSSQVRAYAWPLLWVKWQGVSVAGADDDGNLEAVLLLDRGGAPHAITADELQRREDERS